MVDSPLNTVLGVNLNEGLKVFSNLSTIINKLDNEGSLELIGSFFKNLFENELNFAFDGIIIRNLIYERRNEQTSY